MSNLKRRLAGMSGNGLKGVILFNISSHASGMNGVLMGNKSGNDITMLGIVGAATAEGTEVVSPGTRGPEVTT
jgi:hypothetical protein